MYLMLGLVQLLSMGTQGVFFAYCSKALIFRARSHVFRTLLRQDIAFFDKRLTGTLTSFLATEITHLAGLSSTALSTLVICYYPDFWCSRQLSSWVEVGSRNLEHNAGCLGLQILSFLGTESIRKCDAEILY
jgi:hypothetical protein